MYVYGVQKKNVYVLPISTNQQNNPTQNIRINVEFILIIPIHSYLIVPYTNTSLINYSNTPRKFYFLLPTCTLHKSRRQDQTLGLMVHRLSAHFLAQWPLLQQNVQLGKKTMLVQGEYAKHVWKGVCKFSMDEQIYTINTIKHIVYHFIKILSIQ